MNPLNIKALRKKLKLNQTDFGIKVGASLRSVQMWEKGKAQPSADKLIRILKLNSQTYAYNDNNEIKEPSKEYITNSNGNHFTELPDGTYDIVVKELPFLAYASYLETLEQGEVFEDFKTTTFNVDKYGLGHYMAFTIKGDSMNGGKIDDTPDAAKVLGRELNRQHWPDGFRNTRYGWIILCKQNIFHKDIIGLDKMGNITLHSRNPSPEYADFEINLNNVKQIFKIIKRTY